MSLTTPATTTSKVHSVESRGVVTAVALDDQRVEILPALTDTRAASRWRAAVATVHEVVIELDHHTVTCRAHFTARRRPCTQRLPLRVGLGLIHLGAPARLHHTGGAR